jgi:uncharacterized protein YbjT (DUF2867 family)
VAEPVAKEPAGRIALVAGSSGLIGQHLLDVLLDAPEYQRVFALSRRPLDRDHPRLANRIVQFDKLEAQLKGLVCQDAFCCLGTTIAQAHSEAAFRQVDLDYVVNFARAALAARAERLVVISSVGAAVDAKVFYLRMKGEMEAALARLGIVSLDILQPGLLLGSRRELRPAEFLARWLMPIANPFLVGAREAYRGIAARTVAAAMLGAARSGRRGVYRYTYAGICALAQRRSRVV